jgi:hypothetical protein
MAKHIYDENGKYKGKILSDEEKKKEQIREETSAFIQLEEKKKLYSLIKEVEELGLQKEVEEVKKAKKANGMDITTDIMEIIVLEEIIERHKKKKKEKELNEFYKKDAYEKGVPLNVYMKKVRRRDKIMNIFIAIGLFLFIYLWIYLALTQD